MVSLAPSPLAKLTAPRVGDVLSRTRLFKQLDSMAACPVTCISGPAGSGKTTLALSYLDSKKISPFWYQIDEGDHDLASFFYHLGLLAQQINPEADPLPLLTPEYLQGLPTFTRNFFRQFFNLLPINSVFVLDNYQDAGDDNPIDVLLPIAFQEIPSALNVLILSRTLVPDNLTRLITSGHVQTLNWQALQFSEEEVGQLVKNKINSTTLHDNDIVRLHSRTQGWAAGLTLCLAQPITSDTLRSFDQSQSQAEIFKYFANELFEQADDEVKQFLLQTAFLPSIKVNVANIITHNKKASSILQNLTKHNHFTYQLSGSNNVFEYHPLFKQFLQEQASVFIDKDELNIIIGKTKDALLADDEILNAANLIIKYKNWNTLSELIPSHGQKLLSQGLHETVHHWIKSLPDEILNNNAVLLFYYGLTLLSINPEKAKIIFKRAYDLSKKEQDTLLQLNCYFSAINAYVLAWSEFIGMDDWFNEINLLQELVSQYNDDFITEQFQYATFLIYMYRDPANEELKKHEELVWEIVLNSNNLEIRIQAASQILMYYSWWMGEYSKAEIIIKTMQPYMESKNSPPIIQISWQTMISTYYATVHKKELCEKHIENGLELSEKFGISIFKSFLYLQGCLIHLCYEPNKNSDYYLECFEKIIIEQRFNEKMMFHLMSSWDKKNKGDTDGYLSNLKLAIDYSIKGGCLFFSKAFHIFYYFYLVDTNNYDEAKTIIDEHYIYFEKAKAKNLIHLSYMAEAVTAYQKHDIESCIKLLKIAHEKHDLYLLIFWDSTIMSQLFNLMLEQNICTSFVFEAIQRHSLSPPETNVSTLWPYPVKIYTLGRFRILIHDEAIEFSGKSQKKPLELLKALISLGGRDVRDEQLAEALWPEADGDAAYDSLKTTISRLRKLLNEKNAITISEGKFSLNPQLCWVDIWSFERLLNQHEQNTKQLDKTTEIYQDNFLSGEPDHHWLIATRERLRRKFIKAVTTLGKQYEQQQNWSTAIETYHKGLNVDDLAEGFYQALMRCYFALNEDAEIKKVYLQCEKILKTKLGIEPSDNTTESYKTYSAML